VHGILRTADAISPVPAASLLGTLVLFVLCYGIVFWMGIYYINRLINKGPEGRALEEPEGLPNRPLSAAEGAAREAMAKGG
jgi:cytochrome d ubiquinol oxidase subunit I